MTCGLFGESGLICCPPRATILSTSLAREIPKILLAQFLSNHQGPEPIEPDRGRSDGEGTDRTPRINVQGAREHNSTLGLRKGPDGLPLFAFTGYKFF